MDSTRTKTESHEAVDDPDRLARHFLFQRHSHHTGAHTLIYWRQDWLRWDGAGYYATLEDELRAAVHAEVKAEFDRHNQAALKHWAAKGKSDHGKKPTAIKVTRGTITNVVDALQKMVILDSSVEPPAWIGGHRMGPRNLIAMKNGLLDLDKYFAGKADCLRENSPEFFTQVSLPYCFLPGAHCPTWLRVLSHNLEGDAQRIAITQEWAGLNLVPDTSYHKFFVGEGDGANGKSAYCAGLMAMVGQRNCSHVPMEIFGERFALWPTVGKLANIAAECSEADRVAEAMLKSFVSGDTLQIDRKNKTILNNAPTARLTFMANNRPRFHDRSSGLWRRMILMPFRVTIGDDERIDGMDKPEWWMAKGEVEGMFLWALEGLKRLRQQRRFTRSEVCEEAAAGYRLESNPAQQFLDEKCQADPEHKVVSATLYDGYQRWAKANGYSPLSAGKFGGEVARAFPKMRRAQEERIWHYFGVRFNQFGE
jgi:putative DNA primase/helicase